MGNLSDSEKRSIRQNAGLLGGTDRIAFKRYQRGGLVHLLLPILILIAIAIWTVFGES